MARRIYWESIKKWALKVGAPVGTAGFAILFMYLSFLGVIEVTGHSGDMTCAGTELDPCLAYINFSVKEDIFIYPIDYDPYGRNTPFETDKELKSWKMYRSWGSGWREIKLGQTCTATWCGAPPNSPDNKYAFAFREGRNYQIKIVALKNNYWDEIKWGFGPVDPVWEAVTERPVSYQATEYPLGGGRFKQMGGLGFKNYKDGEIFRPINMDLVDQGDYWTTTESVYYPIIPRYADEWSEFINVYEGNNHSIKVKPVADHVEGIVNGSNVVLYPDAFGEGFDLEVTAYKDYLLRKVIIREPQTKGISFNFEIDIEAKLSYESIDRNGTRRPIVLGEILNEKRIELTEGETPTIIYPMKVWDSNGSLEYIDSKIYQQGGKLYFRKMISKEFLENAVYPVYTDDSEGPNNPGTMADDSGIGTEVWADPNNAKLSDDARSIAGPSEGTKITHYLKATNFGFGIPSDKSVTGIVMEYERKRSGSGEVNIKDYRVYIRKANGALGTENKADTSTNWPSSDTYASYGDSADLWSETWTYANINHANFGVVISGRSVGGSATRRFNIDHIRMTVYYILPCTQNSGCEAGEYCDGDQVCQSDLADGVTCDGETYNPAQSEEDGACANGYCDSDGVGAADDGWCFTPYDTHFDGQENTKCEYSTDQISTILSDEFAVLLDLNHCDEVGEVYFEDEISATCELQDITSVFECTESGCSCGDVECDGIAQGATINYCDKGGQTYFQDDCATDSTAVDYDDTCVASGELQGGDGCTADVECDGITAGTGACNASCAYGIPDIDYSVAIPLGLIRFLNCSPDFENPDARPDGQTAVIAAINATNNGSAPGSFSINLTGALNTGWTIWASNDSLVNNLTLSTSAQTIWSGVEIDETKKIWLAANCSYVSANPGQGITLWAEAV